MARCPGITCLASALPVDLPPWSSRERQAREPARRSVGPWRSAREEQIMVRLSESFHLSMEGRPADATLPTPGRQQQTPPNRDRRGLSSPRAVRASAEGWGRDLLRAFPGERAPAGRRRRAGGG